MSDEKTPLMSRGITGRDALRGVISIAILAILCVCYWFALPAVQSPIIPRAPGGKDGPWVVRPILAVHFVAVAVLAAVTLPLITWPLWRIWKREDVALGTQFQPFQGQTGTYALLVVKASLLLAVYAVGLLFYLFSWTFIGPSGIEECLPWTTLHFSFQDISSLETIPSGERDESISKDGPRYTVKFKGGRSIEMSEENEGTTLDELTAMATFIAERSGRSWVRWSDGVPVEPNNKALRRPRE